MSSHTPTSSFCLYNHQTKNMCCALQELKWGQDEQAHTNFKRQPGHSTHKQASKHGSLPAVLTSDSPAKAAAVPAWCSAEITPGPGYYEAQPNAEAQEQPDKPAVAFGATGDGKSHIRCISCSHGHCPQSTGNCCSILLIVCHADASDTTL